MVYLHENKKTLSHQWLRTWPRFETEAWDNLEMAYCNWFKIGANFLDQSTRRENKKVRELQIHCKPHLQTNISVNENTIPVLIGRLSYPIQAAYPSADQQTDLGTSQARLDVDTLNKNTQT